MSSANTNPRSTSGQVRTPGAPPRVNAPARPTQRPASAGGQAGRPTQRPGLVKPAPKAKARKARLLVSKVDPWSVLKMSFLLSVALGIVTVVAVAVVWSLLGAAGIWDAVNSAVGDVVSEDGEGTFAIEDYLGTSRVLGFTMLVAVVDVVLVTVVATLGAFLYNLAAALLGGFEVTLSEDV